MKRNKTELLAKEILRSQCINKHQTKLSSINVSAKSSIIIGKNVATLVISGKNEGNFIISEISAYVEVYDVNGKKHRAVGTAKNLWVEPSKDIGAEVTINFSFPKEGSKSFCSDKKNKEMKNKSCREWGIQNLYGVKININ